jgi:arylsulfatase A-like enzyme
MYSVAAPKKSSVHSPSLGLGLIALSLVSACGSEPVVPPTPPTPTELVFVITLDTLRADHLGTYGYVRDTSPHMDAFAEESLLFENAITTMSTTLPAHVSLFTGTHTIHHGVESNFNMSMNGFESRTDLQSMAEVFQRGGYQTAAFVSTVPLKAHTGIQVGFDEFFEPDEAKKQYFLSAKVINKKVFDWLETRPEGPTFVWIHYSDPHSPYIPPKGFDTFREEPVVNELIATRMGMEPDQAVKDLYDAYDGEVRYLDHELGRLFAEIRKRGMYDDALITIVGDHGEGLEQHGWIAHGHIYDEQLLVPLMIKFPAGNPHNGTRYASAMSIIDIPNIMDGGAVLPYTDEDRRLWQGFDVLNDADRHGVFSARVIRADRDQLFESGRRFSLTEDRWKYFYLTEHDDELFDRLNDPHELSNVIDEHPDVANRMKAEIAEMLEHFWNQSNDEGEGPPLPEDVIKGLSDLGYTD